MRDIKHILSDVLKKLINSIRYNWHRIQTSQVVRMWLAQCINPDVLTINSSAPTYELQISLLRTQSIIVMMMTYFRCYYMLYIFL